MRRIVIGMLVAAAALCAAGCGPRDDFDTWRVQDVAPIAGVGHGMFVSGDGTFVEPTPERVIAAQQHHIRALHDALDPQTRESFKAYRNEILSMAESDAPGETVLINAAQLSWLLERTKAPGIETLLSLHTAMWGLVPGRDDRSRAWDDAFRVSDAFRARLIPRIREPLFYATPTGGPEYVETCRKAGVPIPPDWGSPEWRGPTRLDPNFLYDPMLSPGTVIADMYVYENDLGMCAALPRHDGTTIQLLGVICLGQRSSRSCYWDNQREKMSFDIPLGARLSIVDRFAGGADLRGGEGSVCSDCHAGENPYIVHPGAASTTFPRGLPAFWHEPMVHPEWPQNPGPDTVLPGIALGASDRSCIDCHKRPGGVEHRLPSVSLQTPLYCSTVLPRAFSVTMPSAGNPAPYMTHYNALRAACQRPPRGDGTIAVNGGIQADVVPGRSDSGGTLASCPPGASDCPVGLCYWRAVHGPFWQTSPAGKVPEDPAYRGSFLRIYAEGGAWKWRAFSDATGLAPSAPPGGVAECTTFAALAGVSDANASFGNLFAVADDDGSRARQSLDITLGTGTASGNVSPLTGFIGNVAHAFEDRESDLLQTRADGDRMRLEHRHRLASTVNYPVAPLVGEAWTFGSPAWTPVYLARDVLSTDDVELVAAADAPRARCFLTGIAGAWSGARREGAQQPFAEIVAASSGELRLRVWPASGSDRVQAYASCIALR
ncbi:MAG: hypothetical protein ACOY82_14375 [Pseudomonadota bacterium]